MALLLVAAAVPIYGLYPAPDPHHHHHHLQQQAGQGHQLQLWAQRYSAAQQVAYIVENLVESGSVGIHQQLVRAVVLARWYSQSRNQNIST